MHCSLIAAGALFDQTQVLRPSYPVFNALESASTSNRNFRGRQGQGSRTHLVSPAMAAAAAVNGHFSDVREMVEEL